MTTIIIIKTIITFSASPVKSELVRKRKLQTHRLHFNNNDKISVTLVMMLENSKIIEFNRVLEGKLSSRFCDAQNIN